MTQSKVPLDIMGVPIHPFTMEDVLERVDEAVRSGTPLHIGVVNAAKIVNMRRNPELRDSVLASDMILADGAAPVLASRLLGQPLPGRVTGIDLMHALLEAGMDKQYRVYCLGATEEVSEKVASIIAEDFPGIVLAGRRNGYFHPDEEQKIAETIAASEPDILFVAITSPKKERFMARWNGAMKVPVIHGVGGSFDVMAGKVQRAPIGWQKVNLEWLYRVIQEPRRLWKRYLVTNSIFCWLLLRSMFERWTKAARVLGRGQGS